MTGPGRSLHNIHYQTRGGAGSGRFLAAAALLLLLGLASSCSPATLPDGTSGPTGSSAPSEPAAAPPPAPAQPAPPPGLPDVAVEARIGSAAIPLPVDVDGTSVPVVDAGSTFEVRLPFAARGARLVLLDSRDSMVPSSADAEVGATSRFTLVPLEPLLPGSRHVLRLEGLESRLVKSDDGRSFEPLAAPFRVAGEPPPAPPKKGKKKRAG